MYSERSIHSYVRIRAEKSNQRNRITQSDPRPMLMEFRLKNSITEQGGHGLITLRCAEFYNLHRNETLVNRFKECKRTYPETQQQISRPQPQNLDG